jgi:hypothetical protein
MTTKLVELQRVICPAPQAFQIQRSFLLKNEGIKIEQGRNSSNSPFSSILLLSVCVAVVAVAIRRRDASSCDVNII